MQIGHIEKHLEENCEICNLITCEKALDELMRFLPFQLAQELYLKALKISVTIVKDRKERELKKLNGI